MTRVTQVGQHVFYRFNRNPAPMRMLARAEEVSPEQTEAPVFASAEEVMESEAAPALGGEVRLTSAVIEPGSKVTLEAMGGPLEPAMEPASAPAAAKAPAKSQEAPAKSPAAAKAASAAGGVKAAAAKPAARDEKPADAKARPADGGKAA